MDKILVTGGAGYIGSVTTQLLLDKGYEVIVFDSLEKGHFEAVDKRAIFIEGNLLNNEQISQTLTEYKPDAIIHFASYIEAGESMEDPNKYFRNNVIGAINLAEAMHKADVKNIVFSSSAAVYGEPKSTPIKEDDELKPTNAYGETKLMIETIFDWHRKIYNIKTIYLRYFNACGATVKLGEDHEPETHLIPLILQVPLGKRDNIYIYGNDYDTPDGTCIRDYVHIKDLALAHLLAIEYPRSDVFNLGSGEGYSVKEIIQTARKIIGHPISAKINPRRPGDPARLIASSEKAKKQLGWIPKHDLNSIIKSAWNWHKSNPSGYKKRWTAFHISRT